MKTTSCQEKPSAVRKNHACSFFHCFMPLMIAGPYVLPFACLKCGDSFILLEFFCDFFPPSIIRTALAHNSYFIDYGSSASTMHALFSVVSYNIACLWVCGKQGLLKIDQTAYHVSRITASTLVFSVEYVMQVVCRVFEPISSILLWPN